MTVRVVPGAARSSSVKALLGAVAGLTVALGLAFGFAAPAHAHNVLRSTSPVDGGDPARTPGAVELRFDQTVLGIGTAVRVVGPDGAVQSGTPKVVDSTVTQPLEPGAPAGEYEVSWRVTSADGHPISGSFEFTARAAGAGTPPATSPVGAGSDDGGQTSADAEEGGRTPWAGIVAGGVLGALAGLALVLRRRRLERDAA